MSDRTAQDQVITAPAPKVAAPQRAGRNTAGYYYARDKGKLAVTVDGSALNQLGGSGEYVFSSAWTDPECGWCLLPRYARLAPGNHNRGCRVHWNRKIVLPEDPFPMSDREYDYAERHEWSLIADLKLNVPHRYRDAHLLRSEQTPAIRATREFLDDDDNFSRSLWLAGPTGTGKTHALIAALRKEAVSCEGNGLVFYGMGALVRALISEESDEVLERCVEADDLYLDDVGSAYLKDGGVAETLFEEIIVEREAAEAPMVCTTNLTLPKLAEVLGDRIADRIRGPWAEWVALPGASLRRKMRPKPERSS